MNRYEKIIHSIRMDAEGRKRILDESKRIAEDRMKRNKRHKRYAAGCLIAIGISSACLTLRQSNIKDGVFPLTVYAQEIKGEEEVKLKEGQFEYLEAVNTPFGEGYAIKVKAGENYSYKNRIEDTDYGVDTIFSKEECLYWIPDYWKSDNFQIYNEKAELLEYYNATKDSKAKVTYDVYDEQEVLRASMTVELSKKEQQGVMKILELHTYPSFSPE